MAFTNDDLAKIEKAIAKGVLSVRYADRSVTYQSTEAMLKVRDQIKADINAAAGTKRKRYIRLTQSGTGYG